MAGGRILRLAADTGQPRVVGVRAREQASVEDRHENAVAVARPGGHARVGRHIGRYLLRFRRGTEVQDMVGRGYPHAELSVDGRAGLLHAPGPVIGKLKPGQAAQAIAVFNRHARHDGPDAIDVSVADKKGALPIEVVDLTSIGPIARPSCRAFKAAHDTGDA